MTYKSGSVAEGHVMILKHAGRKAFPQLSRVWIELCQFNYLHCKDVDSVLNLAVSDWFSEVSDLGAFSQ